MSQYSHPGHDDAVQPSGNGSPLAPSHLDLQTLSFAGMVDCGQVLRAMNTGATSRQQVAERIAAYFYESFRTPETGEHACVLVRCFQTCSYAQMPLAYRDAADHLLAHIPSQADMRCLALLATRGSRSVWNDPATSIGHQAIPLPSVEVVRHAPMIARLLDQLGISLERMVAPPNSADFLLDDAPRSFNVFHVPEALDSPFIPAQQDFVQPYAVRSVLGVGGLLPGGEIFAVILFTRVHVSREVARLFRTLALSIKLALLPFDANEVFSSRAEV